jgi:hypothetical protein
MAAPNRPIRPGEFDPSDLSMANLWDQTTALASVLLNTYTSHFTRLGLYAIAMDAEVRYQQDDVEVRFVTRNPVNDRIASQKLLLEAKNAMGQPEFRDAYVVDANHAAAADAVRQTEAARGFLSGITTVAYHVNDDPDLWAMLGAAKVKADAVPTHRQVISLTLINLLLARQVGVDARAFEAAADQAVFWEPQAARQDPPFYWLTGKR